LKLVLREVETVAPADSTVLIYGETGTGKELIARAVHNLSSRKSNAFVKLNCAAIPTGLLESELSAMKRGVHGRDQPASGRFELAHRGTIFLDEVGEIPWSFSRSFCAFCKSASSSAWQHAHSPDRCPPHCGKNRDLKQW